MRGQGVANMGSAVFAGMGGRAMIGQSVINVSSGGRGRLHVAGRRLVLLVVLQGLLAIVPVAALTVVMIMFSIDTFSWRSIARLQMDPLPSSMMILSPSLPSSQPVPCPKVCWWVCCCPACFSPATSRSRIVSAQGCQLTVGGKQKNSGTLEKAAAMANHASNWRPPNTAGLRPSMRRIGVDGFGGHCRVGSSSR